MAAELSETLTITTGDDYRLEVSFVDTDEAVVDCSAWTDVAAEVRARPGAADPVAFTVDDTDAATGVFVLTIDAADTTDMAPGLAVMDFQRVAAGKLSTLFRGKVLILQGVTE